MSDVGGSKQKEISGQLSFDSYQLSFWI